MAFEERKVEKEITVGNDIIRVSVGDKSIDLRRFYKDGEEWKPTKKGIVLNKEILVDVLPSIIKSMETTDVCDVLEECGFEVKEKE